MPVALTFATSNSRLVRPLLSKQVNVVGFDLVGTVAPPSEIFWRQLQFGEFDIAEMAIPSLLIAREHGIEMVAIPAFPSRRFVQTELLCHPGSGISLPRDIAGKKMAVIEYAQASAVWTRGILEHDFGVPHASIHWFVERSDDVSYGSAVGFAPPPGVRIEYLTAGETIYSQLRDGIVDVGCAPARGDAARQIASQLLPVFPDREAECLRYFTQHRFIPSNHCYAIRADVAKKYPEVPAVLYEALLASKIVADKELKSTDVSTPSDLAANNQIQLFSDDDFPYGFLANRPMLTELVGFCAEQGLCSACDPDDLFPKELLNT